MSLCRSREFGLCLDLDVAVFDKQRVERRRLLPKDVSLEGPWKGLFDLVTGVGGRGHAKDLVELFQGELLG